MRTELSPAPEKCDIIPYPLEPQELSKETHETKEINNIKILTWNVSSIKDETYNLIK